MKYVKYPEDWITEKKETFFSKFIHFLFGKKKNINNIHYWLLEIDRKGNISREISIDRDGNVISIAPYKGIRGLWVDSNVTLDIKGFEFLDNQIFEDKWIKGCK